MTGFIPELKTSYDIYTCISNLTDCSRSQAKTVLGDSSALEILSYINLEVGLRMAFVLVGELTNNKS